MKISELEYLLSDLDQMKKCGGKKFSLANKLLKLDATTHNIQKCMDELNKHVNKEPER